MASSIGAFAIHKPASLNQPGGCISFQINTCIMDGETVITGITHNDHVVYLFLCVSQWYYFQFLSLLLQQQQMLRLIESSAAQWCPHSILL